MDKDLENREHERPSMLFDDALNEYIDKALIRIREGIDLLMAAEEAYTMSRACNPEKSRNSKELQEKRERRDGFREQGNDALFKAQELLFGEVTTK